MTQEEADDHDAILFALGSNECFICKQPSEGRGNFDDGLRPLCDSCLRNLVIP